MKKHLQIVYVVLSIAIGTFCILAFFTDNHLSGYIFLLGSFISLCLAISTEGKVKPTLVIENKQKPKLIGLIILAAISGLIFLKSNSKSTSKDVPNILEKSITSIDSTKLKDFQEHWIDSVVKDWKGTYIVKGFSNKTLNLINFQLSKDASKRLGNIDDLHMRMLQENYDTMQDRKLGKLFGNNSTKIIFVVDPEQKKLNDVRDERQHLINRQFAGFSGANVYVQRAIKENMNDPDSYDHIETTYSDKGKYILVYTKFRGKNSFGATILQNVIAKVDIEGNVISLK